MKQVRLRDKYHTFHKTVELRIEQKLRVEQLLKLEKMGKASMEMVGQEERLVSEF